MSRPTETEVESACRVLRADYAHTVTSYAKSFLEELERGNYNATDASEAREALERMIDGCQDVIYTFNAKLVGCFSRYDWESEAKDMGLEHPTPEQIAYICLVGEVWVEVESDVEEYFESKEVDISDE